MTVQGNIPSVNSPYQLFFGRNVVASGTSDGNFVNANFTLPEVAAGAYALKLRDVAQNINSTGNQFAVSIGYNIAPAQVAIQEGGIITINAVVTGGQPGMDYTAKIGVVSPSGTTYSATVGLGNPNVKGTASGQVTYPSSSFSPSGASTSYAGTYSLKFNDNLARSQFFVNILDSTSYHRGQTVSIHAIGYQPNQAASITFISGSITLDTKQVTASADGVIGTTWAVSDNAPIGDCTVKISPEGTPKAVQDQQSFTIVGYEVQVEVKNLSGQAVPDVTVQASEASSNTTATVVTKADGLASFKLEKGYYGLTALLSNVVVGSTNITVTGDGSFTLTCQLTDTTIAVRNTDGVGMPLVDLNIKFNYQSGSLSKNGNFTGQTDASGTYVLASTLAGATYTIDASVHNQIFNSWNNTFSNLPNIVHPQVTIICPSQNLTLAITGHNNEAIPNARIELVELSNGLFYSVSTDGTGTAAAPVTFGVYRVRIYEGNALIKETNVEVFADTHKEIQCTLYGIHLSVAVVDLFGSPIPKVQVTLNGPATVSAITGSDGIATFNNIVGGNMQIIAQDQVNLDASQSMTFSVNQPATVQVKIDKYISLGGMLLSASSFITVIVVLVAIVLFVSVEVLMRRRAKGAVETEPEIHP